MEGALSAHGEPRISWCLGMGLGFGLWGLGIELWGLGVEVWALGVGLWGVGVGR